LRSDFILQPLNLGAERGVVFYELVDRSAVSLNPGAEFGNRRVLIVKLPFQRGAIVGAGLAHGFDIRVSAALSEGGSGFVTDWWMKGPACMDELPLTQPLNQIIFSVFRTSFYQFYNFLP
jgi:hypothetical protein